MDAYNLERFVRAQEGETYWATYADALREIRAGRKTSHWIWYVFPQMRELGRSQMARTYGIGSFGEAQAYLAHPVLGLRLVEISQALLAVQGKSAKEVLGPIDCVKVRSSMTLFARVEGSDPVFRDVLAAFYGGEEDELTVRILEGQG